MLNYLIVFITVFLLNIVPFVAPPTWIVLVFFYQNSAFDILLLAVVGSIASTFGRIILTHIGIFSRRFVNKKRKKNMNFVGKGVKNNPVKSFIVTFLFALSPISSSVYFMTLGLTKTRSIPIYLGFFFGRILSYYTLILGSSIILRSIPDIFSNSFLQMAVMEIASIIMMIIFIIIDWNTILRKRKLKIIPFKIRK